MKAQDIRPGMRLLLHPKGALRRLYKKHHERGVGLPLEAWEEYIPRDRTVVAVCHQLTAPGNISASGFLEDEGHVWFMPDYFVRAVLLED
jgi:hypothetical protein